MSRLQVFATLGENNLVIGRVEIVGGVAPDVRVMNQRASAALMSAASVVGVWQTSLVPDGEMPELLTFLSDAETEWGGHLFMAQEYLRAKRAGVVDYVLKRMAEGLSSQARALAVLGEFAGEAIETFTVRRLGNGQSSTVKAIVDAESFAPSGQPEAVGLAPLGCAQTPLAKAPANDETGIVIALGEPKVNGDEGKSEEVKSEKGREAA